MHHSNELDIFAKNPYLAIFLNAFSLIISFMDEVETTLKFIALIVSILVGILTSIGKYKEIYGKK
jgi:hypothetical protein